ncbi:AlpA family transcriptional regulator [Vibrio panuliri]|uniref:AlpA family transcriptional regulator n=1 Tax=Vibrio panuliri TaxID=1381081 RepID=A0A1Q9HP73_9VIBR|nr:AlpA family transcriptional regulator [Vibrio panuliri]OLQ92645.1 AlpA family transcriptional regulator [Vibrio panuliri]
MSHKIIRLPEVIRRTGLSRSTIYLHMSKGVFPKSVSLGERAIGWAETDVEQWLDERITEAKAINHE